MGLCNRCSVTVPNAQPRNAVPERSERLPKPGTGSLALRLTESYLDPPPTDLDPHDIGDIADDIGDDDRGEYDADIGAFY